MSASVVPRFLLWVYSSIKNSCVGNWRSVFEALPRMAGSGKRGTHFRKVVHCLFTQRKSPGPQENLGFLNFLFSLSSSISPFCKVEFRFFFQQWLAILRFALTENLRFVHTFGVRNAQNWAYQLMQEIRGDQNKQRFSNWRDQQNVKLGPNIANKCRGDSGDEVTVSGDGGNRFPTMVPH